MKPTPKHEMPKFGSLKRLSAAYYRGHAYVHWAMTMADRTTGWLVPIFYYEFREILTHTMFRFGLCCPIYYCMPDHIHLLWMGLFAGSDQLKAAKYFRRQLNEILKKFGTRFQTQAYDHVLHKEAREQTAFENVAGYIARNPERSGLVGGDCFRDYPYTDCLVPGYPELKLWQEDYWHRFWRIFSHLRENGLLKM